MTCRAALAATNKNKNKKNNQNSSKSLLPKGLRRRRRGPRPPKCLRSKALRQFLRANTVPINRADILIFSYRLSVRLAAKNHKANRCEIVQACFVSPQSFAPPV